MAFDTKQHSYQSLRDVVAERTTPLIALVGSGLSQPASIPSWTRLKSELVDSLEDKARTLDNSDGEHLRRQANSIRNERDFWVSFERLEKLLGATTYRETVRNALTAPESAVVPDAYRNVWKLPVKGVVSLNLDRMATRAYSEVRPGKPLEEYDGRQIVRLPHLINAPRPFLANMHGVVSDTSSWILTKSELNSLMDDEAYKQFMYMMFGSHSVMFVGVSADDFAIGGHLERLATLSVEGPTHYWVTHRADLVTDRWSESVGVRMVRYRAPREDHQELNEFFQDLLSYVPNDELDQESPPVAISRSVPDTDALPSPREMSTWPAEKIRRVLNARARELLAPGNEEAYEEYEEFCAKYDEPIYRAWYVSADDRNNNTLLGYTIEEQVEEGAFGKVFRASDASGQSLAIKILHQDIRKKTELLKSFRRGVRSMSILRQRGVEGMVAYEEASEIPAFAVMEWINGPNLSRAQEFGYLHDWHVVLRVAREIASIIRTAHSLPERVLHRDIRPANVMLKDYYGDPDAWRVVVLDFDLSWHRGATGKSVMHTSSWGYLAPEQLENRKGVSTRNSAVDSFGIGMTCLFMCRGTDPTTNEHLHANWGKNVMEAVRRLPQPEWKSLPARFARLILSATHDDQAERWDVAQIQGEVERLESALLNPGSVESAELISEELAARVPATQGYEWDEDEGMAVKRMPTGLTIRVHGDDPLAAIRLNVSWTSTGMEERKNLGKYIRRSSSNVSAMLKASGWRITRDDVEKQSLHLRAKIGIGKVRSDLDKVVHTLDKAMSEFMF